MFLSMIFIILLFLFTILAITKLTITVELKHAQDNDDLTVTFSIWFGLITYTIDIPLIRIDDESPSIVYKEKKNPGKKPKGKKEKTNKFQPKEMKNRLRLVLIMLSHVVGLHKIVRKFLKHVSITKLEWKSQFGLGDAAITGMVAGLAWSLKGSIIGIVSNYMQLKVKPNISIHPKFNEEVSETHFICIISFRIGHAMGAGFKVIRYWRGNMRDLKEVIFPSKKEPISN